MVFRPFLNRALLSTAAAIAFACMTIAPARAQLSNNQCVQLAPNCTPGSCTDSCLDHVKPACLPAPDFMFKLGSPPGSKLTGMEFCKRFGAPVATRLPRLDVGGQYQDFEFGQIATYPDTEKGDRMPSFVLRASRGHDLGQPTPVEVDWSSTAPFTYDVFQVGTSVDSQEVDVTLKDAGGGSAGSTTLDINPGMSYIQVEGCNKRFLLGRACDQGWSHPVFIDVLQTLGTAHVITTTQPFGIFIAHWPVPIQPDATVQTSTGAFIDEPDSVTMKPSELAPLMAGYCGRPLITSADDEKHPGELADDVAVALLALTSTGVGCGEAPAATRSKVLAAIEKAKVSSLPGTDFPPIVVAVLVGFLLAGAIGVGLALFWFATSDLPWWAKLIETTLGVGVAVLIGWLATWLHRAGDYDMRLVGTIRAYYQFTSSTTPADAKARSHIADKLLTVTGPADNRHDHFWIEGVLPTPIRETENHLWMTESARYLSNNIIAKRLKDSGKAVPKDYDNDQNGMTSYMLEQLQGVLIEGMYELNARPYDRLTYHALVNLADFAASDIPGGCFTVPPATVPVAASPCDVARAARNALDFEAAKFATSSNELRRAAPFRRQPVFKGYPRLWTTGGDDLTWRYFAYTGGSVEYATERYYRILDGADGALLAGSLTMYRPPVALTNLLRYSPTSSTFLQRFHASKRDTNLPEVYYRDPNFLISAGGRFERGTGFALDVLAPMVDALSLGYASMKDSETAWTQPTTLMPTKRGADVNDFVRIMGSFDETERNNTCVAPGFACGMNPRIPAGLPEACQQHRGDWTFIDFTANSATCPFDFGYYVAVFSKRCGKDSKCKSAAGGDDGTFGFFEASPARNFQTYMDDVISNNNNWNYEFDKVNLFVSPMYGSTSFQLSDDMDKWPVVDYGPLGATTKKERNFSAWGIAADGLVTSPKKACIHVDNFELGQRLILDGTDVKHPKRALLKLPGDRCECPLANACFNPRAR